MIGDSHYNFVKFVHAGLQLLNLLTIKFLLQKGKSNVDEWDGGAKCCAGEPEA